MHKISIIALGWLGERLHRELAIKNYNVSGSYNSTPKKLENEYFFSFSQNNLPMQLTQADTIIFNLTPSAIRNTTQFRSFLDQTSAKIIFISSTSVYGQLGIVNEDTSPLPTTKNGKLLLSCEHDLLTRGNSIILRPGGLYGGERHPGNYLAGKANIKGPNSVVNLTSRTDLINLTLDVLSNDQAPKVINAVNNNHPSKQSYYTDYCLANKLTPPKFLDDEFKGKTVITKYKEYKISTPLPQKIDPEVLDW